MNKQIHAITAFRFVAAAYVFLFHLNMRFPIGKDDLLTSIIKNGAVGMVFFFVLSGFILAYSHNSGNFGAYYKKRIARIYPPYIFMGIISAPFLIDIPLEKTPTILLLFATTTQAWFYNAFNFWNFGGSWSVSVEMFFYIIFPIIFKSIRSRNNYYFLIISYVFASAIYPIAMSLGDNYKIPFYYSNPIYRLPEFIFGVSVGYLFSNGLKLGKTWFAAGIVFLSYGLTLDNQSFMQRNYIILPSLALLFLSSHALIEGKNIISKTFIYLGEISYSFYLMQLPILMAIDKKLIPLSDDMIINWIMLFIVNIAMASISYHLVERNKKIRKSILGDQYDKKRQSIN